MRKSRTSQRPRPRVSMGNNKGLIEVPNHPGLATKRQAINRHKEAGDLLEHDQLRCTACNEITSLETTVHIWTGEQFMLALCMKCQKEGVGVLCQRTERGFQVRVTGPRNSILRFGAGGT